MQALEQLDSADNDVIRGLLMLVQDKKINEFTQYDAAQALGRLGQIEDAIQSLLALAQNGEVGWQTKYLVVQALKKLAKKEPHISLALLQLVNHRGFSARNEVYNSLKQILGNLRYSELDNRQRRIRRRSKKTPKPKSKIGNRKS